MHPPKPCYTSYDVAKMIGVSHECLMISIHRRGLESVFVEADDGTLYLEELDIAGIGNIIRAFLFDHRHETQIDLPKFDMGTLMPVLAMLASIHIEIDDLHDVLHHRYIEIQRLEARLKHLDEVESLHRY